MDRLAALGLSPARTNRAQSLNLSFSIHLRLVNEHGSKNRSRHSNRQCAHELKGNTVRPSLRERGQIARERGDAQRWMRRACNFAREQGIQCFR